MKRHARTLIIVFAALGLGASIASLYVHYRLVADPSYTSFCDVNETVSCEAVMTSRYGYAFGVPVAVGGAIWSALVLLLAALGMKPAEASSASPGPGGQAKAGHYDRSGKARHATGPAKAGPYDPVDDHRPERMAGYIFLLSTIGLAWILYLGYASFFVLGQMCPLCLTMYVAVIGLFIVSGAAADLASVPAGVARDLRSVTRSPVGSTLAVVWVVAALALVAWFPREETAAAATASEVPAIPAEKLGPDEVAQFEAWLAAQPRVQVGVPDRGARVVVAKFNDYQCPACRQAYIAYKSIEQKYTASHPGQVAFVNVDYPLEAECNTGGIHAAACEAAVAVRLARRQNRAREMEEWLFNHQEKLTRETVKEALEDIANVTDFDAQYASILTEVRADAQLGQKLQITGTPTFFINGIRITTTLRPAYLDAAIAYELKRPAGTGPQASATQP